jgi:DNA polymerase-4
MAREIKSLIRARTGITASVGVSHNKLLAKLASEMQKPDGLTIIPPEDVTATLDPMPVGRLFGIGAKTAARHARLDLRGQPAGDARGARGDARHPRGGAPRAGHRARSAPR